MVFRLRQALKGSLWVVPLAGGLVGVVLGSLSRFEPAAPSGWDYSSGTALSVLTTVIAASIGLTGFVVTVTILVVQMSAGMFSARYMRIWFRDPVLKAVLAVLVGTFTFSYSLLRHVEGDDVPHLGVALSGVFLGLGVVLFLVFLDRVLHRLRPVRVAELVARAGRRSLQDVAAATSPPDGVRADDELEALRSDGPRLVVRSGRPGAIQAYHLTGLVRWAERNDCVVILCHATGNFVSTGARTVEVYAAGPLPDDSERRLESMVALDTERTIEQDPAFALRIMVDVAIRALSPAVNDPTTAVQVLNHLEDLLVSIGRTSRLDGRWELRDRAGVLRVVAPAHRWEDFLGLSTTEIRQFGSTSIQVLRRMRAMLLTLHESVLPEYVDAVEDEQARLDATVAEHWGASVDDDLATVSDRQGIGGVGDAGAP